MGGAVLTLPQYAFMAWCSGVAEGQILPFTIIVFQVRSADLAYVDLTK